MIIITLKTTWAKKTSLIDNDETKISDQFISSIAMGQKHLAVTTISSLSPNKTTNSEPKIIRYYDQYHHHAQKE